MRLWWVLPLFTTGCLAGTTETPRFEAWNVGERVGLAGARPTPKAEPTRVVVVPNQTTLTEAETRRTLCAGEAPCELALAPGSRRVALYDGPPSEKPAAEFWLDVDERPATLTVERPKIALPIIGSTMAVIGLVSVVFGGLGKEADGDETTTDVLLFGGLGAIVVGFSLGGIYWASGRGKIEAKPLAR
jgi:hypothetical protein